MGNRKQVHTITLDCGHVRTCFNPVIGYEYYCIQCENDVSLGIKEKEEESKDLQETPR